MQEATRVGDELEPVAVRIGNVAALSFCLRIKAWSEFGKHSDLIELHDRLQIDLAANEAARLDIFVALSHAQLSVAEFFRGNWEQALKHAQAACRPQERHVMRALSIGAVFRQMAYLGDRDGALALLHQQFEKLPRAHQVNNLGSWAMLLLVVEGLLMLGEREQAAALYPLLGELIATGAVCFAFVSRFPRTIAGLAATAARQWQDAEEHFQVALRQAQEFPHQVEMAEIRRFYGAMLLERSESGDSQKARALLTQAGDSYDRIGMRRHSAIVEALLKKSDST
jgi:tetratricopeptide (TPR) repeat protein